MSAITYYLGDEEAALAAEREARACIPRSYGLSGLGEGEACETQSSLQSAHIGLLNMVYVRSAIADMLSHAHVKVQFGNLTGADPNDVFLILDKPVGKLPGLPEWNPPATPDARQYKLLSWTSKMACPSWSLPAGGAQIGGTCPGALAGQSLTSNGPGAAVVRDEVKKRTHLTVRVEKAICEHCYAEGGQYSTGGVQVAQVLRLLWATQAIQTSTRGGASNAFVDTMIAAISKTKFRTEAFSGVPADRIAQKTGLFFFRIHDSGDFANKLFVQAWRQIADALPGIVFWAPSRIWATPWGVDVVNRVNVPRRNLIIRPSAYHVSEAPPRNLGPGWSSGSSAIAKDEQKGMTPPLEEYLSKEQHRAPGRAGHDDRYDWNCQAYAVAKGSHTCRHSTPPPWVASRLGIHEGCRACWIDPDSEINYTLH